MLPFEKYQVRFGEAAAVLHKYRIIDVRSPGEFAEDCLPGAVNLPVLDNEERAAVGTLYKNDQFAARDLGARLISANISKLLESVAQLQQAERRPFLVYCWRGGMRSRALFTVMHLIGYRTELLAGGYQAYRRTVQEALYQSAVQSRPVVVHGYTGSGKTRALLALRESGSPVLDLEGCANHRGSLLGKLPGGQPTQKEFESRIFAALPAQGRFLVEGESRKIGRLSIPPSLWNAMKAGEHVWVEVPLEVRARQCVVDYAADLDGLRQGIACIEGMSGNSVKRLHEDLDSGRLEAAATVLLQEYYDPLYRRHGPEHHPERYAAIIKVDSVENLVQSLKVLIQKQESAWTPWH